MDIRKLIFELEGGPVRRLVAKLYIKNKSDDDLRELISSQKPGDVLVQKEDYFLGSFIKNKQVYREIISSFFPSVLS